MAFALDIILFAVFAFILARSSIWAVKSVRKISSFLKLGEFVTGFLILAIATSLPELFVSINAAMMKNSELALGNVIGSNIADIAFVLAIVILLSRGIKVKSRTVRNDSFYMLLLAALPIILLINGSLSRIDGVILLVAFAFYVYKMLKQRRKFEKKVNQVTGTEMFNSTALFIVAIALVIISANLLVKYGINISKDLSLPPIIIGLFLIALGTSLPELVLGIRAIKAGYEGLSLGNIIGSVAVNSTLVLGVAAVISPITPHYSIFLSSGLLMLGICLLFMAFIQSGQKLSIKEGVILLMCYIFFIIIELGFKI